MDLIAGTRELETPRSQTRRWKRDSRHTNDFFERQKHASRVIPFPANERRPSAAARSVFKGRIDGINNANSPRRSPARPPDSTPCPGISSNCRSHRTRISSEAGMVVGVICFKVT